MVWIFQEAIATDTAQITALQNTPAYSDQNAAQVICPIGKEVMRDPVLIASDVSYDRHHIVEWFKTHDTCPCTRQVVNKTIIIPNLALKALCEPYWAAEDKLKALRADISANTQEQENLLTAFVTPETNKPAVSSKMA